MNPNTPPTPTASSGSMNPALAAQMWANAKTVQATPVVTDPEQTIAAAKAGTLYSPAGSDAKPAVPSYGQDLKNIIPNIEGDVASMKADRAQEGAGFTTPASDLSLDTGPEKGVDAANPTPSEFANDKFETQAVNANANDQQLSRDTGFVKDETAPAKDVVSGILGPVLGMVPTINPISGKVESLNKVMASPDYQQNSQDLQQSWESLMSRHPVVGKTITNSLGIANNLLQAYAGAQGVSDVGDFTKGALESKTEASPDASDSYRKGQAFAKTISNGKLSDINPLSKSSPEATLASRIKDATPSYDKSMTSQNVKTAEGDIVPRINSEGKGLTGERPVTSSAADTEAGKELNNIPDYPDKGTALQKSLSAKLALSDEAESMRSGLQKEDTENPLEKDSEISKVEDLVKSNLPKEIQDRIGYLSKDNPLSRLGVKMSEQTELSKAVAEMQGEGTGLPKTPAGRYYQALIDGLKDYDGSREGKLDLRQKADDAFDRNGGNYTHGSDSHAELSETHKDIRNALNKDLAESTTDTDTKSSLKKQTNLYHGIDVLNDKAAQEAPSSLQRFMQRNPVARMVNRMVLRRAIGEIL